MNSDQNRKTMTTLSKVIVILMFGSFAFGIFWKVYFDYLEYEARLGLPPEMRTQEAIQQYYDGAACLTCGVSGTALMTLFFGGGILLAFLYGLGQLLQKDRKRNEVNPVN